MANRMDENRNAPGDERDLDGLDDADRALVADLAPDVLPDPGEAYFASLGDRVLRRIAEEDATNASLAERTPWWKGFAEALRIRPVAIGIPAAVAVAMIAVLILRPTSRIPGLDWETLDAAAIEREAKRLNPARTLMVPSELESSAATDLGAESDDSAIEITVDFDDMDVSAQGIAPPYVPVADVSGAALSDEELTELRERLGEALDSLKI